MRTYKFGSRRLSHEQGVTIPSLWWLGVTSSDVLNYSQSVTHLTIRDQRKSINLTRKLVDEGNMDDDDLTHELQLMLMLNIKAEIQAVDDAKKIGAWLDARLV